MKKPIMIRFQGILIGFLVNLKFELAGELTMFRAMGCLLDHKEA